jgi:hypothetical protein
MVKIITKRYRLQEEKTKRNIVEQHIEAPAPIKTNVGNVTKKKKKIVTAVATDNNISENVKENE